MKLIALATAFLGAALAFKPATAQAQQTLRLGHNISATSPYHLAAEQFGRLVAERTSNRIRVQVFSRWCTGQ